MSDSRVFPITRYVQQALEFFDQPPHVAAGALYGQADPLTVDQAIALITAYLGHVPVPPEPGPDTPPFVLIRPRGNWSGVTVYLPADAVIGTDGNSYCALTASDGVNPVGDSSGTWEVLVPGGSDLAGGNIDGGDAAG